MNQKQAQAKADALAERLEASLGTKWEPCVWENRGWCYCVKRGLLKVYPAAAEGEFYALLGTHGGAVFWTDRYHSPDPVAVVIHQLAHAAKVTIDHLNMILSAL